MVYIEATDDQHFNTVLALNKNKLVIVDFSASWCGPCKKLEPQFKNLAEQMPQTTFLKVDIDLCKGTAAAYSVNAVPTIMAFVGPSKMDTFKNNMSNLNDWISGWEKNMNANDNSPIPGQLDLMHFINFASSEVLNDEDSAQFRPMVLNEGEAKVISDCDEQLIMNLVFTRPVKIHSVAISGPGDEAPKTVKLFTNVPVTLDFDKAQSTKAVQQLDCSEAELHELRFVKFQNIRNLQLFVMDNKGGDDKTIIDKIKLYGQPMDQNTNMADFKRVAGKAGEVE